MSKLPISVCIIAKNEQKNIDRCLSSLAPYGFEIIIVDTGSTDQTKEIAAKYTDCIFNFTWIDDFSAARNYSLQMASNNWILMIDCDEWIESIDIEEIKYFQKHYPHDVGSVRRQNITNTPDAPQLYTDTTERLFSKKYFHYEGIIHEQLRPKHKNAFETLLLNTTIGHTGYFLGQNEKIEKAKRNLQLLFKQMLDEPNNPYIYFQIGKTYISLGDSLKTCLFYEKALSFDLDPQLVYVNVMIIDYGCTLLELGQKEKALSLRNVYDSFSSSADFVYTMGMIYLENNLYEEALDEFQKALTFDSCRTYGVTSFLSYYQIGKILLLADESEMAIKYFKLCQDYSPALKELEALGKL